MTVRICGAGDNVVDRYVDLRTMYPGGNALNVAVHARRRGADTAYVGVLGDDPAGVHVARSLAAEGVDTSHTRIVHGVNAYAVVRVVDGDREFETGFLGVSPFRLGPDDFEFLRGFDLVHTGDCSGLESQIADIARVTKVSFDFSSQPRDYAEPLLPHVELATFSASGRDDAEVAELIAWAHGLGARQVLVTRGPRGATLSDGRRTASAPAHGGPVVDTLGAGDALTASVCVDLLAGRDLADILPSAAAYAASTCQSFGAFGYETPDTFEFPHLEAQPHPRHREPTAPVSRHSAV